MTPNQQMCRAAVTSFQLLNGPAHIIILGEVVCLKAPLVWDKPKHMGMQKYVDVAFSDTFVSFFFSQYVHHGIWKNSCPTGVEEIKILQIMIKTGTMEEAQLDQ